MNSDKPTTQTPAAESTPKPSYAPAGMSMGIIMLMWGILTHWIMSAVGACLMAWSLYAWIHQISEGRQT